MLSPTQLVARYRACTSSVDRTQAAGVDPSDLTRNESLLSKMGWGEPGRNERALGDPPIRLGDLEDRSAQNAALEALIRPFTVKLAEIDVSPCSRMDLRHIGKVLEPVAEAKAAADGLEMGAELSRVAQITKISGGDSKSACVRGVLSAKAAASVGYPLNRMNPKLRTPGIAIEQQLATGKPAKVGLSGSMGGAGGTGKLKSMGAGTPNANPVNAYSGIGVNGQVNGNAALGTRNNALSGAAKMGGAVVSIYNLAEALDEAVRQMLDPIFAKRAAAGATFKQNTSYDPICPHCGEVMYEKHFVPDRDEGSNLWRHRGDCYDKGAFPIVWPDQHERDAETKKMLSWLSDKKASGDMLAFKAWKATGLSNEEADRKAGESLALPGDKCHHCHKAEGCRTDDTCNACGKYFWGPTPKTIGTGDGDGGYWAKEGERCQHCFALHERGDDGNCNSCGKVHDHPDYLKKKAYVEPLPRWKKDPQKSLSPEFVAQPGVQNLLQSLAMAVDEHGHVVSKRAFDRSLWEEYNGPLTDDQMDGLTMGHGCVLGSCGHRIEGCRCHGGKLIREKRDELCHECRQTEKQAMVGSMLTHAGQIVPAVNGVATDEKWRSCAKQAFVTGLTLDELREAAAVCEPNPSEAQKKSGNYAKGHIRWKGLPITIETAKGYTRSGTDGSGKPWSITMKDHYGYVKQTVSEADGDHFDVFLCEDNLDSDLVFVVNQFVDGKFDEHKAVLGCDNEEQARKVYLRNYADGWDGLESIRAMPIDKFKRWIYEGNTAKKVAFSGEDLSLIGVLKVAMDDWYAHGGNAAAYEGGQGERKLRKLWLRRDPEGLEEDNPFKELFQAWAKTAEFPSIASPLMEAQQLRLGSDDPLQHILGAQHLSNFLDAGKNRATRSILSKSVPKSLLMKRPELKFPAGPSVPPALPMPKQPALIQ